MVHPAFAQALGGVAGAGCAGGALLPPLPLTVWHLASLRLSHATDVVHVLANPRYVLSLLHVGCDSTTPQQQYTQVVARQIPTMRNSFTSVAGLTRRGERPDSSQVVHLRFNVQGRALRP